MADDVTAPGSGEKFATDQDPGSLAHYPLEKIAWGPNDTFNRTDDASGKRFPVKVGEGLAATAVVAGQVTVAATEAALSSATARRFRLRAALDNAGVIAIGPTGVTLTTGFRLWPGDAFPFGLELSNLNVLHALAANANDKLDYLGEV